MKWISSAKSNVYIWDTESDNSIRGNNSCDLVIECWKWFEIQEKSCVKGCSFGYLKKEKSPNILWAKSHSIPKREICGLEHKIHSIKSFGILIFAIRSIEQLYTYTDQRGGRADHQQLTRLEQLALKSSIERDCRPRHVYTAPAAGEHWYYIIPIGPQQ